MAKVEMWVDTSLRSIVAEEAAKFERMTSGPRRDLYVAGSLDDAWTVRLMVERRHRCKGAFRILRHLSAGDIFAVVTHEKALEGVFPRDYSREA